MVIVAEFCFHFEKNLIRKLLRGVTAKEYQNLDKKQGEVL
jgi:hypothetical protein